MKPTDPPPVLPRYRIRSFSGPWDSTTKTVRTWYCHAPTARAAIQRINPKTVNSTWLWTTTGPATSADHRQHNNDGTVWHSFLEAIEWKEPTP